MWSAFRADLQEFVSTVTVDTSTALSKLDAGMSGDEDDANETTMDSQENGQEEEPKAEVNHAELKEIMNLLRDHSGTYTTDLTEEEDKEAVEEYLANFSIEGKTDEIAEVLKTHESTVQKQFEELCPTHVCYEEFWKRYFFRCDEDRIARQLQEETERARKARAEAIEGGIQSVANFFGGAVKAVASTIAPDTGDAETHKSQQGINFFGAKGRPPFVMNTAVSESGDETVDGVDEEDEELGWDDDDEDDDVADDVATEQIEFTDKVSEDLQEKVKQAIAERDLLQQTVHMQANEIKALQNKLSGNVDATEVDQLKLQLFEKDAELAALRARVHEDDVEDVGSKVESLKQQLEKLPSDQLALLKHLVFGSIESGSGDASKVASLEQQVQELSKNLDSANDKLSTTMKELEEKRVQVILDQTNAQDTAMKNLEAKLQAAEKSLEASQAENDQLRLSAEAVSHASASQLASLKEELACAQQGAAASAKQLEKTAKELKLSEEALQEKLVELAAATRGGTPDTVSTGVKVAPPAHIEVADDGHEGGDEHEAGDVQEGDDWGDDWD